MKNILILDDYQNAVKQLQCFDMLKKFNVYFLNKFDPSKIDLDFFKTIDCIVLIRQRTKLDKLILEKMPKLTLISQTGPIGNHIDIDFCKQNNIHITTSEGSQVAVAELTWLLIMAINRNLIQSVYDFNNGLWQNNIGLNLKDRTLGIWGFGVVGKLVANYAKCFGMNVEIFGSKNSLIEAEKIGYGINMSKESFLSKIDILTLHLRLADTTKDIFTYEDFCNMKKESFFINTSRFELVEKNALEKSLINKIISGAAIDVFNEEPVYNNNYDMYNNLICTPHIGYVTKQNYELYFQGAFKNIIDFYCT